MFYFRGSPPQGSLPCWGPLAMTGTFLAGRGMQLALSGQRSGALLNILQCAGQPCTKNDLAPNAQSWETLLYLNPHTIL